MKVKFYAVAKGRTIGIFESWDECKQYVDGFSYCCFKSFKTKQEAKEFLEKKAAENNQTNTDAIIAMLKDMKI